MSKLRTCENCGNEHSRRGRTCSGACAAIMRKKNEVLRTFICEECGLEFESPRKKKYCKRDHKKNCAVCGKEFIYVPNPSKKNVTCGPSCGAAYTHTEESRRKRKENNLEKYGVEYTTQREDIKKKMAKSLEGTAGRFGTDASKAAIKAMYGVENVSSLDWVKEKKKETSLEHYGVENPSQLPEIREKMKKTLFDNYGVESPLQSPELLEKSRATSMERYGTEHPLQSKEIKEKVRQTNQEKYGVDYTLQVEKFREKGKITSLAKYGTEYPSQSEIVKEKMAATNLERYGAENPFQSEEIKEKIRSVMKERYGAEYPLQIDFIKKKVEDILLERYGAKTVFGSPEIQERIRKTMIERYGVVHPSQSKELRGRLTQVIRDKYGVDEIFQSEEIRERIKETMIEKYGVEHALHYEPFKEKMAETLHSSIQSGEVSHERISKINRSFADRLKGKYNVDIEFEKNIGSSSFDLYIPEKDLYIDINPTVSHNSTRPFVCVLNSCPVDCEKHEKLSKDYHFKRSVKAFENDKSLIQFYDWDKPEHIALLLDAKLNKNFLKLSSRKLTLKEISSTIANKFLEENHIQKGVRNQEYCYGLFKDDDLLAVATFGKPRFNSNFDYEFLRYSIKKNHIIYGGAERIFKEFLDKVSPENIISYVDFDHTTRKNIFLSKLGFEELNFTGPSLNWFNLLEKKRVSQNALLKIGADRILKTQYGSREESGLNNEDIMLVEGYLKVFNSGNRVFSWSR